MEKRFSASDAAEHPWLGGLSKANETRAKAADVVAAREVEANTEKALLTKGRRRGVRRRVPAAIVRTDQGKGVVGDGEGAKGGA